jgi:nucleolar pre-ribosomal-associated protein 2
MIRAIPEADKVLLIERLLPVSDQRCTSERAVLVRCIISVIQGSRKIVQKEASSSSPETGSVSILVRLLELLNSCSEYEVHQQLVACVISVLRDQV